MSRKLSALVLFVVSLVALSTMVSAAFNPVTVDMIKINGDTMGSSVEEYDVEDELEVKLRLVSPEDVEEVFVTVLLHGYKYETISDSTRIHKLYGDRSQTETFNLELPELMESGEYNLEVLISGDKNIDTAVSVYDIFINKGEHDLMIDDVVFFDSDEVRPGQALYTIVRVMNNGEDDEENVKVSVSVPELDIKTSDFMDEVEGEDSETSTELYLRVPVTAKPGVYDAVVELEYDNGYETVAKTYELTVLPEEVAKTVIEAKTLVSAAIEPQTARVGSTVVYPITISNLGDDAVTYTVTIETADDWATFKVSPSNLVLLEPKEAKTVYLYVTPKAGADEENIFVASINGNDETQQVALQTDVVEAEEETGFRKTLEIGLIVLVVLLVIIGLIVAFTKLASRDDDFDDDEDDDDESTQTYY